MDVEQNVRPIRPMVLSYLHLYQKTPEMIPDRVLVKTTSEKQPVSFRLGLSSPSFYLKSKTVLLVVHLPISITFIFLTSVKDVFLDRVDKMPTYINPNLIYNELTIGFII